MEPPEPRPLDAARAAFLLTHLESAAPADFRAAADELTHEAAQIVAAEKPPHLITVATVLLLQLGVLEAARALLFDGDPAAPSATDAALLLVHFESAVFRFLSERDGPDAAAIRAGRSHGGRTRAEQLRRHEEQAAAKQSKAELHRRIVEKGRALLAEGYSRRELAAILAGHRDFPHSKSQIRRIIAELLHPPKD